MGELTRAFDWSKTSLGSPEVWSQSCLTSVYIMLTSKFPSLVFWGKELVTFYNDAFRPSLGNEGKHPSSLGQPGHISWAESWPVIGPMIHNIMAGGDAVWFEDQKLPIYREGRMGYAYWTYCFSPILDDDGSIGGLLVTCTETTRGVESLIQLGESESRFSNLVREANVGIVVLTGEEKKVEIANDGYARIIGFHAEQLLGKPIFDMIPAAKEVFEPVIDNVRNTEEIMYLYNAPYSVADENGNPKEGFVNLIYQPYREKDGSVTGVIVLAQDTTEQVLISQELNRQYEKEQKLNEELASINEELSAANEEMLIIQDDILSANARLTDSEERLRLTIESSNLGSCYMNMATREFIASPRMKELYGFYANEDMGFNDAVSLIADEYREMVLKAIDASLNQHQFYEVEYPVIGYHDKMLRWIKATGKIFDSDKSNAGIFFGTVEDITERKRDEQRKSDFIAMVSHEMKTPLTSMSGFIQLLQLEAVNIGNTFITSMSDKAARQVNKMTGMINGFLNVSRLESGKLTINKARFDLAQLIKDAEEESLSLYSTHRIIFHPAERIFVNADRDKMASVINNLVSNAVKYSAPGTAIHIVCIQENGMAQLSVSDEGAGIRKEDIPKLFDRYYRVEDQAMKAVSGFGIGLYLSCEIVHHHGGTIWVTSEVGEGSTFYFTIPID